VLSEVLRIEQWSAALYTGWTKTSNSSSWHALLARALLLMAHRSAPCCVLADPGIKLGARSSSFSSNSANVYFSASRSLLS
jgi:hypothetical protein